MIQMPVGIEEDIDGGGIHLGQDLAGTAVDHQAHCVFYQHAITGGEPILGKYGLDVLADCLNHNECA
jgi:hypothetical protein